MLQGDPAHGRAAAGQRLELVGKVIFAVWLVPVRGYRAVCFCEPTTGSYALCLSCWRSGAAGAIYATQKKYDFFAKRACNLEVVLL